MKTRGADTTTIKMLLNSVVSTPNTRFITADINNFYLNTEMEGPEYTMIQINLTPQEIIEECNVMEYVVNGLAYLEINKGLYGLPQSVNLANDRLIKELSVKRFEPTNHTPGLWKQKTRPVTFALVVDDFGIKYIHKEDVKMLLNTLQQKYEAVSVDWSGKLFCGMNLE